LGTGVESKKKSELGQVLQFVGDFEKLCWREGGVEGKVEEKVNGPKKARSVNSQASTRSARKWGKQGFQGELRL
jgi:hypothetical protein